MPRYSLSKQHLGIIVLIATLFVPPFILRPFWIDFATVLLISIILAVSLRFITLIGEWSFAHVGFMGIGAYSITLMTTRLGWSFWASWPLAVLVPTLVALMLSYPCLKTRGVFFFMSTFAAGEIMRMAWIEFRFFGGVTGLANIPHPESISLPGLLTIDFGSLRSYYLLTLGVTLVCLVFMYRLERSRIGQVFKAIASQELLAESVGIRILRYRTMAFVIGSSFAGMAGVLLVGRLGAIDPRLFSLATLVPLYAHVVVGGAGSFAGPIIGVVVLGFASEALRNLRQFIPLIYGAILIVTLLTLPGGLVTLPRVVSSAVGRLRRGKGISGTA